MNLYGIPRILESRLCPYREGLYNRPPGCYRVRSPLLRSSDYRKLEAKDVKLMLANSEYIVRYGETFSGPKDKPVISYSKKINNASKRCIVLLREKF